jgi:hypothetical protein
MAGKSPNQHMSTSHSGLEGHRSKTILLVQDDPAAARAVADVLMNSTDAIFHVE